MSGGARLAAALLAMVNGAWAAAPAGVPAPILHLDTLCTELGSWQSRLSDRTLGPAGRVSAATTAWIVPLGAQLGVGIPRARVVELLLQASGPRLDAAVLQLAGEPPRIVVFGPAAAERLAQRWFEDGPTYYELLVEAMARHGERRGCDGGFGALVRAALAEMTAATYLRVDSEGEVFLRGASDGYLVRERTRFDDGSAQLAWNAVLPWSDRPQFMVVHWQIADDDVLAMAPAATGVREADAAEGQPAWVAALGTAIADRDLAALIRLSAREAWTCRLRNADGTQQPCPAAAAGDSR